ncbi:MAG: FRG domain-containing protein [Veillonellaceae bacterium]|nr:FRG domain-containing protein [Veillonellaceae bacterium]
MSNIYSRAWVDILNKVDDFMAKSSGIVWFRGHSSSKHLLKSGLFRTNLSSMSDYLALESKYYHYYKSLGYLLHDNAEGWELVYSLQHHGGRTRLLDWSESFGTALYFALANWTGEGAAVWMLDPLELNYLAVGEKTIISPALSTIAYPDAYSSGDAVPSIAIYPIKNTQRICSQLGVFTVQGNYLEPLDKEFGGRLVQDGRLEAVMLTADVRQDALRYIKQNGISHFSLFPDLDGLAAHLNNTLIKQS